MSLLERHDEMFDRCIDSLNDWKDLITLYFEDDMKEVETKKLQNIVKEYCIINTDFERSKHALEKTEEHLNDSNTVESNEDVPKLYKLYHEQEGSNQNYQNNDVWKKIFKNDLDVVEVKKKKEKVDSSQYDDLGDSILCSSVFTPPIDPISKAVIKNPYKNKRCKHVYENSTIVNYIKQQKDKAKCPYIGCNNSRLRMSDIVEDGQLQTQIENFLETQASDSDESD